MRYTCLLDRALLFAFVVPNAQSAREPLTFRLEPYNNNRLGFGPAANDNVNKKRHVFKILQLADLHWGEDPSTDKGRKQDRKTAEAIQVYLETEQPDLVVLSGDQITADFYKENARDVHGQVIQAMKNVMPNIKWCILMGNHDDHPYEVVKDGEIVEEIDAETSRQDLLQYDSKIEGSHTQPGELSNYKVPIYHQDGTRAVDIFVFDSGGGMLPKKIHESQVDWFRNESVLLENDVAIPIIAFSHIPTREGFEFKDGCVGEDSKEVKWIKNEIDILEAMVKQGHVHLLGVGHNHGNDYCCHSNEALNLCFGRHSGYGGYEAVDRGARVYELELLVDNDGNREFSWSSWVRLDTGETENFYGPTVPYGYLSPSKPTQYLSTSPSQSPSVTPSVSVQPSKSMQPSVSPTVGPTTSPEPTITQSNEPSLVPTISLEPTESPPSIQDDVDETTTFLPASDGTIPIPSFFFTYLVVALILLI